MTEENGSVVDPPALLPSGADGEPEFAKSSQAAAMPIDESVSSAFPGSQARMYDESHLWGNGNLPAASLSAQAPVEIAMAGVVANQVGPISIAPEIRVQDVLSGSAEDRDRIRNDRYYLEAVEWQRAWQQAVDAISVTGVIVVVAPRGYGATTFSLRLLACHAPENAKLIRLEADWASPKISKLPLRRDRAYQLDLQDPDHDAFAAAFLNALGKHSTDLKSLGSCLVLTVANELWPGQHEQVPEAVSVVRLNDPPDALHLVERYLTVTGLDLLVPYARQPRAAEHIQGRNAVQAMHAANVVVMQWREHRRQQSAEATALSVQGTIPEPLHDASGLDSNLAQAIEQALGDWQDDLDKLFDQPGRSLGKDQSLPPEDRCLLMSLAMHQAGTAAEIEFDALALEQSLGKGRAAADGESTETWSVFSRRGLRPRLRAFKAKIDGRDRVTFNRPGYSEAVLAYVWENYSALRDGLVSWMVRCTSEDSQSADPAIKTLTALILRLQDAERLTDLRDSAISEGRPHAIVRVMAEAAKDEHIGRRARHFLYDWASLRPDIQYVVIAVCRELIGVNENAALVRLSRVARHATDAEVRKRVLAAFQDVAADQRVTVRFANAVAAWQKARPTSLDTKLGLLALLATETDGVPWFPSHHMPIDMAAGLRGLLSESSIFPETGPILVRWLQACAQDEGLYATVHSLMAEATRDRHAFLAGAKVMGGLMNVRTTSGSIVGEDMFAEIAEPELRSLSQLTRTET